MTPDECTSAIADKYVGRGGQPPLRAVAVNPDGSALPPLPEPIRHRGVRLIKPGSLSELTPRHKLVIEYMVNGLERDHIGLQIRAGQPLTAEQVASVLNVKRRYVRRLLAEPLMQKAMASAVAALRSGATINAIRRIIALVDEPGEGMAADRKVQLQAAQTILGEQAKGNSVNVSINNTVAVNPGYVIDLSAPQSPRPTIDITPSANPL